MGGEEEMVGASAVVRELGIPRSTLYRLIQDKRIPTYTERKPWQRRETLRFKLSEVRAALEMDQGN